MHVLFRHMVVALSIAKGNTTGMGKTRQVLPIQLTLWGKVKSFKVAVQISCTPLAGVCACL